MGIYGMVQTPNENLEENLATLAQALEVEPEVDDIEISHHLPTPHIPPIIVRFASMPKREELMTVVCSKIDSQRGNVLRRNTKHLRQSKHQPRPTQEFHTDYQGELKNTTDGSNDTLNEGSNTTYDEPHHNADGPVVDNAAVNEDRILFESVYESALDAMDNSQVCAEGSQENHRTCFKNETDSDTLIDDTIGDEIVGDDTACDHAFEEDGDVVDEDNQVTIIMTNIMDNVLDWNRSYRVQRSELDSVEQETSCDSRIVSFCVSRQQMGIALRARARVQINLAVSQVVDIKQVATFPDIIFPIMWFEDGIDGLPSQVTDLLDLATNAPPIARAALSYGLFALGGILLILAVSCLVRSTGRQETLNLEGTNHYVKPAKKINGSNGTDEHSKSMEIMNPAFVGGPENK
uniref:Scavenger receptor class B member 1 n=1 Tax=Timema tahoe TaxID=61484 RepID=A0A7R9IP08_9NEOP|nr:unnamed protein product [Timema tahoe]